MSIAGITSHLWTSATTALSAPTPDLAPISTASGSAKRSATAPNATPGASNPFQGLAGDLQAWLNQTPPVATPADPRHAAGLYAATQASGAAGRG